MKREGPQAQTHKNVRRRQNNKIVLDNTYMNRVNQYLDSFPLGSLNHLLAQFSPVPMTEALEDKFEYFYRPYTYRCNTEKFISYEGEGTKGQPNPFQLYEELIEEEKEAYLDLYLDSCGTTRNKSNPQREMQKTALMFQMERVNYERTQIRGSSVETAKKEKALA